MSLEKTVLELDRLHILSEAQGHIFESHILVVAEAKAWPKFWDDALEYGPKVTKSTLATRVNLIF